MLPLGRQVSELVKFLDTGWCLIIVSVVETLLHLHTGLNWIQKPKRQTKNKSRLESTGILNYFIHFRMQTYTLHQKTWSSLMDRFQFNKITWLQGECSEDVKSQQTISEKN